jgi:asparagine synthase (glutamine-hydrolysing)
MTIQNQSLFIARDRIGIKPLYYANNDQYFTFSSELKGITPQMSQKKIDIISLFTYLQLNYVPSPHTMLLGVNKLLPGHYIFIENIQDFDKILPQKYYEIPLIKDHIKQISSAGYQLAMMQLKSTLEQSVKKRLVADVPLGTFLSGGIDSSIITTIAAKHKSDLNTFSIGYKNHPYFDETKYALAVAKKNNTNHHVFQLDVNDFKENFQKIIDSIDEPMADSSCIPTFILAQKTSKFVRVALSGDGADEMFAGYNKHYAEYKTRNSLLLKPLLKKIHPILSKFPQSRNNKLSNLNRKLIKFSEGINQNPKERYWKWASILNEEDANYLLKEKNKNLNQLSEDAKIYKKRKDEILKYIENKGDFNQILYTDMHLVLENDMLKKVDLMSMANGLEVRTPFLDHQLVDFSFSLPSSYKINNNLRKKILQEAYKDELPAILFNRQKKGFEVPLTDWLRMELKEHISTHLANKDFIEFQNIFNYDAILQLKNKLFSSNPGDAHHTVWALIVFQNWWNKNFNR